MCARVLSRVLRVTCLGVSVLGVSRVTCHVSRGWERKGLCRYRGVALALVAGWRSRSVFVSSVACVALWCGAAVALRRV